MCVLEQCFKQLEPQVEGVQAPVLPGASPRMAVAVWFL